MNREKSDPNQEKSPDSIPDFGGDENRADSRSNASKEALLKELYTHPMGRPLVMGILNVTPDSFSDGGIFAMPEAARARLRALQEEGADLIDIGAESTRPGATPVPLEEERRRLLPVLEAVCAEETLISVDTQKAAIARESLALGAKVINDVGGFQKDPLMAETIAAGGGWGIILHAREHADPSCAIVEEVLRFFEKALEIARKAGLPEERLLLDPGLGFGKTLLQNYKLLQHLPKFKRFGLPLVVGASRKRMIGDVIRRPPLERLHGTVAAHVLAVARGAQMVRVHDVQAHFDALKVAHLFREVCVLG